MNGKWMLYIDQYGNKIGASTAKELKEKHGSGTFSKMYMDKKDGRTVHVGYCIGAHWFIAYAPVER